jgi:hypothetical protein
MCFLHRLRDLWVRLAITFRDQAEHERRDYECGYSSFNGSETKPLPHFIEFETPTFVNQIANPSKEAAAKKQLPMQMVRYGSTLATGLIRIAALR